MAAKIRELEAEIKKIKEDLYSHKHDVKDRHGLLGEARELTHVKYKPKD